MEYRQITVSSYILVAVGIHVTNEDRQVEEPDADTGQHRLNEKRL